jgi:predicted secreted Zn-dependent protease
MSEYLLVRQNLDWHVSRTCESGACIMVAGHGNSVVFGNTTKPDGPVYAYTKAEWKEFIAGVKSGDFDDIV